MLAFDCAGGHAGDDLSRGDEGEDYGWDGDEHAYRHDLTPVDVVLGHEQRDVDRDGARAAVGEYERQDKFIPSDAEGEDGSSGEPRLDERQDDEEEDLPGVGAIHARGFF